MESKIKREDFTFLYECAQKLYGKSRTDDLSDFPMSERRKFYQNGNRNDFEKLYFRRRDYLSSTAVLALFDEKYISELEKIIFAVCDEYCWALPAHTDGTKLNDQKTIDLFVAETSFALAEICSVFGDCLSENVISKVKTEIRKRLVDNFERFNYWWEKCNMNWAAVCAGYVGGTLIYLFPEEFDKQKDRIIKTLQCYIDGFTDDGFCLEGPSYWLYGFTAFSVFTDLLYRNTDGKEDLFSDVKVKNVAAFASRCFLKGNTALSFSDADKNFKSDFALQQYLHKRFPDTVPYRGDEVYCLYDANTKWMNYYRAVRWSDKDTEASDFKEKEVYSPFANQLIINKPLYSFAFKGGHNDEPHNHNDIGSFIYSDKDGQVLCDLGSGRYTKDYFDDSKRYSIFCNSSLSHSVPVINGKQQMNGKEFSAVLSYEKGVAICDVTKAYDEENLKGFIRKAKINDSSVIISDSFDFTGNVPVTERFVSERKAEVKDGELIFGVTKLKYPADKVCLVISEEKHSPHEYDKEDITVYCYDFILKENIEEITFEIITEDKQKISDLLISMKLK